MKYLITYLLIFYHVVIRGVTHGDELIYLFSAGVFDLTFLDWEIARVISNLWANFVIHGCIVVTGKWCNEKYQKSVLSAIPPLLSFP